jgi:hypothetical protein
VTRLPTRTWRLSRRAHICRAFRPCCTDATTGITPYVQHTLRTAVQSGPRFPGRGDRGSLDLGKSCPQCLKSLLSHVSPPHQKQNPTTPCSPVGQARPSLQTDMASVVSGWSGDRPHVSTPAGRGMLFFATESAEHAKKSSMAPFADLVRCGQSPSRRSVETRNPTCMLCYTECRTLWEGLAIRPTRKPDATAPVECTWPCWRDCPNCRDMLYWKRRAPARGQVGRPSPNVLVAAPAMVHSVSNGKRVLVQTGSHAPAQ